MSRRLPLIMTLHDAWLLSGHCAHSLACQRWQTGCGACPDLTLYPAIRKDNTAQNWKTKRAIYQDCQLYLATPSQWLMDKVQRSMLAPAVRQARVIPYGIDLSIFRPGSQAAARQRLGLPALARVVVFVATHARQNAYKDYQTIEAAAVKLSREWRGPPLFTIALGASGNARRLGNMELRYAPFENDPGAVASYYQASDVYVHAAKADTFPNVVLEAMACGTPVVATAIGGIPEQVVEGETGLLTPPADADAMAAALERILGDDNLRAAMAQRAVERARRHYDLARQTDDYLDFYGTAIADFAKPRGVPSNE